mgnify:CR=1 FL=1
MGLFHELCRRWEPLGLERLALVSPAGQRSFGDLRERALRAARLLIAHGLQPGEVLAVQLPRCPELLELHLGALAIGVVTLPVHDRAPPAELDWLLRDSDARMVVLADPSSLPPPGEGRSLRVLGLDRLRQRLALSPPLSWPAEQGGSSPAEPGDTALACLLYTSGTTGRPKGAMISHGNLRASIEALHEAWRWSPQDHLLHVLPLFHVHGLVVAQHGALWAGARTTWMDRFEPEEALRLLERLGCSVFMGVPTHYQRLLALPEEVRPDLSRVRLFTSGSAPLSAEAHRAFQGRFGHRILERYGMTEVGIVLSNPYEGERRPGSVGLPLPGVQARIVAEEGRDCAPGEVGELWIRGPSVFQGYLGQPEASAQALVGGWMHTGDLALFEDGGRIRLVGRARELIISGGFNVYPAEVEAVLAEVEGVDEVAVYGRPDADKGERVCAAVVPWPEDSSAELMARLKDRAEERLSPYKRPVEYRMVHSLPRNALGKLQRHLLSGES